MLVYAGKGRAIPLGQSVRIVRPMLRSRVWYLGQDTTQIPGSSGFPTDILPAPTPLPPPSGSASDVYAVPPTFTAPPQSTAPTGTLLALLNTPSAGLPSGSTAILPTYSTTVASTAVPAPSGVSLASVLPSGLGAWLTSPSPISSLPNWGFYGGIAGIGTIALSAIGRRKGGRRR